MASRPYEEFWNDERLEREKPYWVESIEDRRLMEYLQVSSNLQRCFEAALSYADRRFGAVKGTVLDLGAGVGWTTALVSRWPAVEWVWAVDYSQHRLLKIAPIVFEQLGAAVSKIQRHCGPMTSLPESIGPVDLAIFCQALYMAGEPIELLKQVGRLLTPGGVVIVSCERIEASTVWRRWRRRLGSMRGRSLTDWPSAMRRALPDVSGRYSYEDEDYRRFFSEAGFAFESNELDYPLHEGSTVRTANYFGRKLGR